MTKIRKGAMLKCIKSFHSPGLIGGFTKEYSYLVLKVTTDEVFFLDDEMNLYDPMSLSLDDKSPLSVYNYFNVEKDA